MSLFQHVHTTVGTKACGASCIMCAGAERGAYAGPVPSLLSWMNEISPTELTIGNVEYKFSGIALRVTA